MQISKSAALVSAALYILVALGVEVSLLAAMIGFGAAVAAALERP